MTESPNTYIHPEAKIGNNVMIEPFAYIDKDVVVGDNCWIGPNACLWEGTRLGNDCKIFPGAQVSCLPQDLKYSGEKTTAEIGDRTTIREFVTVSRGTKDRDKTIVGSDSLIMSYVHIAHDCHLGDHCIISNAVQIAGHVTMGDYAIVGGTAAIRQFTKVGSHVMIAGGSLVRKDVPPYVSAAREPLGYSGINAIGLRRRGYSKEQVNEIQEIYRIVYMSDLNTTKAIARINEEFNGSVEKKAIVEFIAGSERGIMKGLE